MSAQRQIQVVNELKQLVEIQRLKHQYVYSVSAVVPNNGSYSTQLTINQDASFYIENLSGVAYGPTNAAGVPVTSTTDFPTPGATGYANRGLTMSIKDQGSGKDLFDGLVPVEMLMTPGYGSQFYQPLKYRYLVNRNSTLTFEFRNRDTVGGNYHYIFIALLGNKYYPEAK